MTTPRAPLDKLTPGSNAGSNPRDPGHAPGHAPASTIEAPFQAGMTLTKKLLLNGAITIFSACMVAGSTTVFLVLISQALRRARSGVESAETLAHLDQAQHLLGMGIVVVIVTVILACIFVMTPIVVVIIQVTRQIRTLDASIEALSHRDFTVLPEVLGKDDLAGMSWKLRQTIRVLSGTMKTVRGASDQVEAASSELGTASVDSDRSAEQTSQTLQNALDKTKNSQEASTQADSARIELQEQMQVMSGASQKAGELSTQAVNAVDNASKSITELNTAAEQISSVAKTIADIAEQTNLLALNATIEAARAGEAGKGFEVVAGQVKELATQTATATADVESKVRFIQDSTLSVVSQIKAISGVVDSLSEVQQEISGALGAQDVSARNLVDSLQRMNTCVTEMTELMHNAVDLSEQNATAAGGVSATAQGLKRQAAELDELVSQFSYLEAQ